MDPLWHSFLFSYIEILGLQRLVSAIFERSRLQPAQATWQGRHAIIRSTFSLSGTMKKWGNNEISA
jgi:hypothetical protein